MWQYRIVFVESSTAKTESLTMAATDADDLLEQLSAAVIFSEIIKIERLGYLADIG